MGNKHCEKDLEFDVDGEGEPDEDADRNYIGECLVNSKNVPMQDRAKFKDRNANDVGANMVMWIPIASFRGLSFGGRFNNVEMVRGVEMI